MRVHANAKLGPAGRLALVVLIERGSSLRAAAADRAAPERRYLRAASRIVARAWRLTAAADLALPAVTGRRPLATRAINVLLRRVLAAAAQDPELAAAFVRVFALLDP